MRSPFQTTGNNLDFLRLFFAVTVIFSHSYAIGMGMQSENYATRGSSQITEPMLLVSHGQTTFGTIAVDAFFIISGFLIGNSFLRSSSIWTYFRKRIARIYPGFLACALILALVVVPIVGGIFAQRNLLLRVEQCIGRTLFLWDLDVVHTFVRNPLPYVVDGSLWTISWEFGCYIGLAALGIAGLLHRRRVVLSLFALMVLYFLASAVIVWLGAPASAHWTHFFDTNAHVQRRGLPICFAAGTVFYLYRDRIPHRQTWAIVAAASLAISCFIPAAWIVLFPLAGTYLIFWFAFHPAIRMHRFARYGDFSYGTYLYAFTIQQLIVWAYGHTVPPIELFLMAAPASVIVGVLSWYGVERWFLGARRRRGEDAPILDASAVAPSNPELAAP